MKGFPCAETVSKVGSLLRSRRAFRGRLLRRHGCLMRRHACLPRHSDPAMAPRSLLHRCSDPPHISRGPAASRLPAALGSMTEGFAARVMPHTSRHHPVRVFWRIPAGEITYSVLGRCFRPRHCAASCARCPPTPGVRLSASSRCRLSTSDQSGDFLVSAALVRRPAGCCICKACRMDSTSPDPEPRWHALLCCSCRRPQQRLLCRRTEVRRGRSAARG